MIIRPKYKYHYRDRNCTQEFWLLELLRDFSVYDYKHVLNRSWHISNIEEFNPFIQSPKLENIYGWKTQMENSGILIEGTLLMETLATINDIDSGLFLRVVDTSAPIYVSPSPQFWKGPESFQSPNIDLEIRISETWYYEIITTDQSIIDCVTYRYKMWEPD